MLTLPRRRRGGAPAHVRLHPPGVRPLGRVPHPAHTPSLAPQHRPGPLLNQRPLRRLKWRWLG